MGRPTKLNDEMLAKAWDYLDTYSDSGEEVVPTVAGLSLRLKVARSTIYNWIDESEEGFLDIASELMAKQELKLVSGGLSQDFNASITKLMLTKHNYQDKQDNTLSAPGGGPVQVQELVFNPVGSDD